MKNILLLILLTLGIYNVNAQQDTVYFSKNWKVCIKDSAVFYRIKPVKVSTKEALGYKIKDIDSLYTILDYYIINNQLQFRGFAYDEAALYVVGDAIWYKEDGTVLSTVTKTKEDYVRHKKHLRLQYQPVVYAEYMYVDRHNLKAGLEYCFFQSDENKLFLGMGYGIINYNRKAYGLLDYHLSYNTHKGLVVKAGGSDKHVYATLGLGFLNFVDLTMGYSLPFTHTEKPVVQGVTIGLLFRFSKNDDVYGKFRIGF